MHYGRGYLRILISTLLLTLWAGGAAPLRAQTAASDRLENALINGALGSVSSAVTAAVAGKNPWKAIVPGFAGGAAMSAGKQLAGLGFPGAGLVGRQVSAAGISVIHWAALDTPVLLLPLGPLTFTLRPLAFDGVHPRLNVLELGSLVYFALDPENRWDVGATLASAAPVFRRPTVSFETSEGTAYGQMVLGTIVLGAYDPSLYPGTGADVVLAHESVHVLQLDFFNQVIALPPERAVLRRLFGEVGVLRYVDFGLLGPAAAMAFHSLVEYGERPWEREATLLSEGRDRLRSFGCSSPGPMEPRRC